MSLVRRFIQRVFRPEPFKVFVGKDFEGNSYYEIPAQRYYLGLMNQPKNKRIVLPAEDLQKIAEKNGDIVVPRPSKEWESWLRWKRNDAPTYEEQVTNLENAAIMQEKILRINQRDEEMALKKENSFISNQSPEKSSTVESWMGPK